MCIFTKACVVRSRGSSNDCCDFRAERSGDRGSRSHQSNKVLRHFSDSPGEDTPRPANAAVVCCFCFIMKGEARLQLEAHEKIETQLSHPSSLTDLEEPLLWALGGPPA